MIILHSGSNAFWCSKRSCFGPSTSSPCQQKIKVCLQTSQFTTGGRWSWPSGMADHLSPPQPEFDAGSGHPAVLVYKDSSNLPLPSAERTPGRIIACGYVSAVYPLLENATIGVFVGTCLVDGWSAPPVTKHVLSFLAVGMRKAFVIGS